MPWKERFRHAQLRACFKRCPSNEITSFDSDSSRSYANWIVWFFWSLFLADADNSSKRLKARQVAIIFVKQFSGREIIEAKLPEPGGGSIWSAAG